MPTINEVGEVNVEKLEEHFRLNNKLKRRGGPVDILIGVDYAYLMTGETKKSDGLVALNSPLGWAIFGSNGNTEMVNRVMHVKVDKPVNLDDFWTVESMGVDVGNCDCKAKLSVVENMEAKLIEESSSKVGNQWLIPYPWAKDPMHLSNNKVQATKMLNGLERRLKKNEEHGAAYQRQMEEMVEKGFARKLEETEIKQYQGPVHYLPHHAVVRAESKSTPVRIVFNSANKCNGEAINDR
ncbi:uncharacterized protein LOC117111858 [Anneissia japonica]|uniref:uncharacterized protein LOC117111858 n=1 Tax=Anneissia japonica TaxID=1529436 RepID=UPI001425BA9E|nr:uncharacterized protein LOC117111858 [Anneissia japonica]